MQVKRQTSSVRVEEEARWSLAERLFSAMERLDPSQVSIPWSDLGRDEKDFYRASIRALESERDLWLLLLRGQ